jgi:hypothetical protein
MRIAETKDNPTAELFEMFRHYEHTPRQRNTRAGYVMVECTNKHRNRTQCPAYCTCSSNQRDGWYVLVCADEVNSKCGGAEEEAPAAVLANMHAADMESCDICGLETTDLVHCRNRHAFCINDFSRHIDFVINRSRQNFIENGCALPCSLCKGELRNPAGFQRQCASQLDDRAYSFYEAAITEKAVIAAQSECELRIRSSFKPASQDPDENTIGKMVSFHHTPPYTTLHHQFFTAAAVSVITEELVYPRCPNCKVMTPDFEACAALNCECGIHLCAWCFSTHKTASLCHTHVVSCPFNLNYGEMYPPSPHPMLWWSVMHEWARKRIRDYIQSQIAAHLQQRVHDVCKKMHPHLGLVAWSAQGSGDGFRQAPELRGAPPPTFQQNVSTLMAMGLADRFRAEHVLQGLSNNLAAATNLLLAYNDRR